MLPLGILWLTNRHSRKQKEADKSLENKFNTREGQRHQEQIVYSSLSKILFDVQQLHSTLSATFSNDGYIADAIKKFDGSVAKYHGDISNNMLYLSSPVINLIYKFYNQVNELKRELTELNEVKAFDVASVSVYNSSQGLAETVIQVQELFIKELSILKVHFDKTQQEMMKNFCGSPPPDTLMEKYRSLKQSLATK
jgi:uncharacterized membrane-anchored protein YhcB (DUF1043 family)